LLALEAHTLLSPLILPAAQVVKHHNRSVTVMLACPLNNPAGRFDVVGYVPYLTEDELVAAGVSKSVVPVMRAMVLHQCLYVAQRFGGMCRDSEKYPVEFAHRVVFARNVMASLRMDHKARLEALALVGISRVLVDRFPACRRHLINGAQLNRIVSDAEAMRTAYSHNEQYRKNWVALLGKLQGPSRAVAIEDLRKLGWRPIEPALFHAYLFDGAHDTPEDIHHVGPLGIGLFMLEQLVPLLHLAWPDGECRGKARDRVVRDGFLVLRRHEEVSWVDVRQANGKFADEVTGTRKRDGMSGRVLRKDLIVQHGAEENWRAAVGHLNSGLKNMSQAYVRGYKRFDFNEFSTKTSLSVFNRATTLELELLYITFLLPSILPASGEYDWLAKMFLSYNQLYFNWRRDCYFESDGRVMERQRMEFKGLAMKHLSPRSPTQLQTAKFEALDHIVPDIVRHAGNGADCPRVACVWMCFHLNSGDCVGLCVSRFSPAEFLVAGPSFTGSGPGDQAHTRAVKEPFRQSSKTRDKTRWEAK
jgi:hypothetical protein